MSAKTQSFHLFQQFPCFPQQRLNLPSSGEMGSVIARSEATKQSSFLVARRKLDCFASLAMTVASPQRAGAFSSVG